MLGKEAFDVACHACLRGNLPQLQDALKESYAASGLALLTTRWHPPLPRRPQSTSPPVDGDAEGDAEGQPPAGPVAAPGAPRTLISEGQFAELVATAVRHDTTHLLGFLFGLLHPAIAQAGDRAALCWQGLGLKHVDPAWIPLDLVLGRLQSLHLADNRLTQIPVSSLSLLPSLCRMDLSNNLLRFLPPEDQWCEGGFPCLEEMVLDNNHLTTLPPYMMKIRTLVRLSAARNQIAGLPAREPWELANVRRIDLSGNRLARLPAQLLTLPSLEWLDLSHNCVEGMPQDWVAPALTRLDLSHNRLEEFPAPSCLPAVRHLDVSHNRILEVPHNVLGFRSLQHLDISHNPRLARLPLELGALPALSRLGVRGVACSNMPRDICRWATPEEAVIYVRQTFASGLGRHDSLRVPVIGRPGAGKTSLVRAVAGGAAGASVLHRHRPGGMLFGAGPYLTFELWDVGTDLEYSVAHACFLDQPLVYLLTWNIEEGEAGIEDLRAFLGDMEAKAPGSVVVVAGTFFDRVRQTLRSKSAAKRHFDELCRSFDAHYKVPGFPTIVGVAEVSTTSGHGLGALRDLLHDAARRLRSAPGVLEEQSVPKSFLSFVRGLRDLAGGDATRAPGAQQPHLAHSRAVAYGRAFLDDDHHLSDATIAFFYRLAHHRWLLYWHQDRYDRQKDIYFLDVPWLVRACASVLLNPRCDQGVMLRADVLALLREQGLVGHLAGVLVELLLARQVLLPLGDDRLLCPPVLPAATPLPLPSLWSPSHVHQRFYRRYVLPSQPSGLLPLLTAKLTACYAKGFGRRPQQGGAAAAEADPAASSAAPPPPAPGLVFSAGCDALVEDECHLSAGIATESPGFVVWAGGIAFRLDSEASGDAVVVRRLRSAEGLHGVEVLVCLTGRDRVSCAGSILGYIHSLIEAVVRTDYRGIALPTAPSRTTPPPSPPPPPLLLPDHTDADGTNGSDDGLAARGAAVHAPGSPHGTPPRAASPPGTRLLLRLVAEVPCVCSSESLADGNDPTARFSHFVSLGACASAALASDSDSVVCRHNGAAMYVPLSDVAPDYLLGHFGTPARAAPTLAGVDPASGAARGRPCVVAGWRDTRPTVVRLLSDVSSARAEAARLSALRHANLDAPVGCWKRPLCLAFDPPPFGTLRQALRRAQDEGISFPWPLCYALLLQVLDALQYLEAAGVVACNLTCATILVFSLETGAGANVRLSGECLVPPPTREYTASQAPEVMCTLQRPWYNPKSVVFSLAMVLYELLSLVRPAVDVVRLLGGLRPSFFDLPGRSFVRLGLQPLLDDAWHHDRAMRPDLAAFRAGLGTFAARRLRFQLDAPKDSTLETAAVQLLASGANVLWVSCGDTFSGQVLKLDLGSTVEHPTLNSGFWVRSSRLLCSACVGTTMWIGTQAGEVLEYSLGDEGPECVWSEQLTDSVLSIVHLPEHDSVLVGLANGRLHLYSGLNTSLVDVTLNRSTLLAGDGAAAGGAGAGEDVASLLSTTVISTGKARYDLDMESLHAEDEREMQFFELGTDKPLSQLLVVGEQLWCGRQDAISVFSLPDMSLDAQWAISSRSSGMTRVDLHDLQLMSSYGYDDEDGVDGGGARAGDGPAGGEEPSTPGSESGLSCHSVSGVVTHLHDLPSGVLSVVRRDSVFCVWDRVSHALLHRVDCAAFLPPPDGPTKARLGNPHAISACTHVEGLGLTIVGLKSGSLLVFGPLGFDAPLHHYSSPRIGTIRILHPAADADGNTILFVGADGRHIEGEETAARQRPTSQLQFFDLGELAQP